MREPKYKRVLLKISGEALAGDAHRGLDFAVIGGVCDVIKQCVEAGVQVGVVVGGGNFWRGVKDGGGKMERGLSRADGGGLNGGIRNGPRRSSESARGRRGALFLSYGKALSPL